MSLEDAFTSAGPKPPDDSSRAEKKNYTERISNALARELADDLRSVGFAGVLPEREGAGECTFYGGLGSKKVDVSLSDDAHGLLLAISLKGILFRDTKSQNYRKNLANRRGDLCVEAITLHMRFPFAVVAAIMFFDAEAASDNRRAKESTFDAACRYLTSITKRRDQSNAYQRFEHLAIALYDYRKQKLTLYDPTTKEETALLDFLDRIKETFLDRNPHWLDKLA